MTATRRAVRGLLVCGALAGCVRAVPVASPPAPGAQVSVRFTTPRVLTLEADGRAVRTPALREVSGPVESASGDTVRVRAWRVVEERQRGWAPPVGAVATVVTDSGTRVAVRELDGQRTATVVVGTTLVAWLLLRAFIAAVGSEGT